MQTAKPSNSAADVPDSAIPAIGTIDHATAQTTPISASVRIRLRPCESRATGSCASTITSVLAR